MHFDMSQFIPAIPDHVAEVYEGYPPAIRESLYILRALIYQTAAKI